MGARGRKSSAELMAPPLSIEAHERPDAPYDLDDVQAEEWRAVVNRLPADWFPRETWPLLAQYCRHVVAARHVAKLVHDCERNAGGFDVADYDRLLKMQEREGRALTSLATKMRISQQSTYDRTKKKPIEAKKLWE
jgi:hypothetical protein